MRTRTIEDIQKFFATEDIEVMVSHDQEGTSFALVFKQDPVKKPGPWRRVMPWFGWGHHDDDQED